MASYAENVSIWWRHHDFRKRLQWCAVWARGGCRSRMVWQKLCICPRSGHWHSCLGHAGLAGRYMGARVSISRADSRLEPSQWETALLCNDVFHWLGANLDSTLSISDSIFVPTLNLKLNVHILTFKLFYFPVNQWKNDGIGVMYRIVSTHVCLYSIRIFSLIMFVVPTAVINCDIMTVPISWACGGDGLVQDCGNYIANTLALLR